jgi:hypothetical protein
MPNIFISKERLPQDPKSDEDLTDDQIIDGLMKLTSESLRVDAEENGCLRQADLRSAIHLFRPGSLPDRRPDRPRPQARPASCPLARSLARQASPPGRQRSSPGWPPQTAGPRGHARSCVSPARTSEHMRPAWRRCRRMRRWEEGATQIAKIKRLKNWITR